MWYQRLLRPLLFALYRDAETAHERTLALLHACGRLPAAVALARRWAGADDPALARTVFSVHFPNPFGLAAGMDKDGVALRAWAAMGFGFVEAGTVTTHPQPGNPRPRLFRLPQQAALINRMGFNNAGAAALAARLAVRRAPIPLGISLGKSKITPVEAAAEDYCNSLRILFDYGAYFAVNVSSPNTPGLRNLQDGDQLRTLLAALQFENRHLSAARHRPPRPLLVKIAPDLSDQAIGEVLDVCAEHGVAGIIAVNTTLRRDGLTAVPAALREQAGGLSGAPLRETALRIVRLIHRETGGGLPIIGVGGIATPDDALRMLDAGASLLQVYTGLVYGGPGLVKEVNRVVRGYEFGW